MAGLVERLNRSGPTVSHTVVRMQRDGLLHPTESPYGNPIPGPEEFGEERS
jgi:Mn-dependent DtxR family transcriptional regulator